MTLATTPGRSLAAQPAPVTANLACFAAMVMWAFAFPSAEVLLQSWGPIALGAVRQSFAVLALLLLWITLEGLPAVIAAPWKRGLGVGGLGFGVGAVLLLVGQALSDPVMPAIAAAMMPIAGAALEVTLDGRRLRPRLIVGIALALCGGYLATGVNLADGRFGSGALMCFVAVILFAWATRAATRDLPGLTPVGQTTVTLTGATLFVALLLGAFSLLSLPGAEIGRLDAFHLALILATGILSLALAQLLWIWGAGSLGILLASLHMNAVPFYVMVIVVVWLGGSWSWRQALGAALVAAAVLVSQDRRRGREHRKTGGQAPR